MEFCSLLCGCTLCVHWVSCFLDPSIYSWAPRLFPCLGYCEWHHSARGYAVALQQAGFCCFRCVPRIRLTGSYDSYIFRSWRNLCTGFHASCTSLYSPSKCKRVPVPHILASRMCVLGYSHWDCSEMESQDSFDLHSPDGWKRWTLFHIVIVHLYLFFWK